MPGANRGFFAAARSSDSDTFQTLAGSRAAATSVAGVLQSARPLRWPSSIRSVILGAVGKRSTTSAGSTSGSAVSSVKRPCSTSCNTAGGDERLHDAAGPEAIARAHGDVRLEPTEPSRACPAAAAGPLDVQDRSRDLPARACDHVVEHLLEPARERGIELRTSNRPGRSGDSGRRVQTRRARRQQARRRRLTTSVLRSKEWLSWASRWRDASTLRFMRVIGVPPFGLVGSDIVRGPHRRGRPAVGPAGVCRCV